jgi:hypothetical protein
VLPTAEIFLGKELSRNSVDTERLPWAPLKPSGYGKASTRVAQAFTCAKWLFDCMNMCPGCACSSWLPSVIIKQSDKKTSLHPPVEKNPQAWARVSGAWCRRWNANFEACSTQFAWIWIIGVLRPHRKCQILEYAGCEADWTREGRICRRDAPKKSWGSCLM